MKTAFALYILVAFCAALTFSHPAPRAIRWERIISATQDISDAVSTFDNDLVALLEGRPEPNVGKVWEELQLTRIIAAPRIDALIKAAENHTLTYSQASEDTGKIKSRIEEMEENVADVNASLPSDVYSQVWGIFRGCKDTICDSQFLIYYELMGKKAEINGCFIRSQ